MTLSLLDWRRRVAALYAVVRAAEDPEAGWQAWHTGREELIGRHPDSPLRADARAEFTGLPVAPYDLLYSFGVVHHTPHPDRALAQMRRYAAPGGEAKVMVYNRLSWKVAGIVLRSGGRIWDTDDLVARYSEAQTGCPVTYAYSPNGARRLLEGAGFRVTKVAVDHIFPYRVPDYREYRYVRTWYFEHLPRAVFRRLEQSLGWHILLHATAG